MSARFDATLDKVLANNPALRRCSDTVAKEILHIEILRALSPAGLLDTLVFKGGTCLRMVYGGVRLSEDMDFSGGGSFSSEWFGLAEAAISKHLSRHYDLESSLCGARDGGQRRQTSRAVLWMVTKPASPGGSTSRMPTQRVKIEVDDSEPPPDTAFTTAWFAHRNATMPSAGVNLRCVPVMATMVDKLIALPVSLLQRHNPRYRDIWDLNEFLTRKRRDRERVIARALGKADREFGKSAFAEMIDHAVETLPGVIDSDGMRQTLGRFLPEDVYRETLDDADYRRGLAETMRALFTEVRELGRRVAG